MERTWRKVQGGMFKFEKYGDSVEGILLSKEVKAMGNKTNTLYRIKKENLSVVSFFGTTLLNSLLDEAGKGEVVKVVYTGDEASKVDGNNDTKLFEVFIEG